MKRLLTILSFLFIAMASYAQPVDFSTYERVIQRGKVSIVRQSDEYRLIVGSLKNPKICLFLGINAKQSARQMERIQRMGKDENYQKFDRMISFCGECFSFSVTGLNNHQTFSFRMMNAKPRFSLSSEDVRAIKEAIA